jgi:sugar lactone lactonase YvrE
LLRECSFASVFSDGYQFGDKSLSLSQLWNLFAMAQVDSTLFGLPDGAKELTIHARNRTPSSTSCHEWLAKYLFSTSLRFPFASLAKKRRKVVTSPYSRIEKFLNSRDILTSRTIIISSMTYRYLLPLLLFSLLAPAAKAQSERPLTSSIETIAGGEPASIPGPEFNLSALSGLAADLDGNVYFSVQAQSRIYRLGRDGRVMAYAGNGVRGKQLDGAAAASSPLFNPYALATDAEGNLYITCANALLAVDVGTHTISKVFDLPYRESGPIELIHNIESMLIGPDSKLYFTDGGDHRIKTFSFTTRAVSIIAGNGIVGQAQPGAIATSSSLRCPQSLAVASDGTVYFGDLEPSVFSISPEDGRLREISLRRPDDRAPLNDYDNPHAIVLDQNGSLFVAQGNRFRVLRISLKTGAVSLYAGTTTQGFHGNGGHADGAELMGPTKLALGPSGNLFVGESSDIRSVESPSHMISVVVGRNAANPGVIQADDPALKLSEPAVAMAAPDGSVYIASTYSNRVLRLDHDGQLASVAGGGDFITMSTKPGAADQVALNHPEGLWIDANGDLYFSDYDNTIIRRLDPQTGAVSNFARTPKQTNSVGLYLYFAGALVADSNSFFLSDPNANCVWRISRQDGSAEIYAGVPPDWMVSRPKAGSFQLATPSGLALDAEGNLYMADGLLDQTKGRILRIQHGSRKITTILSNLHQPAGLAFQSPDVLCFSEAAAHQVRCVNLQTRAIRVVAGTGKPGLSGDGGAAECAQLNRPMGISFDTQDNLYVADTGNQRVRLVRPGAQPADCNH